MRKGSFREMAPRMYAVLDSGRILPVAVDWERRRLRVARVSSSWVERSPGSDRHGFALTLESGDTFAVSCGVGEATWSVDCILMG